MNLESMQVKIFKALAHPIRLKIVKKLMGGSQCVYDLNDDIEFSQSNLSQHLKILKDAGILVHQKNGLKVIYSIHNNEVKPIIKLSEEIIRTNLQEIF